MTTESPNGDSRDQNDDVQDGDTPDHPGSADLVDLDSIRKEQTRLRAIEDAMVAMEPVEAPPELLEKLQGQVHAIMRARRRRHSALRLLPYAAALLIGLSGIAVYQRLGPPAPTGTAFRGDSSHAPDVSELDGLLRHPDASVRAAAAEQLGATRSPSAVAVLVRALEDGSAEVRVAAARALGGFGGGAAAAIPDLERCRNGGDEAVRAAAEDALGRIRADQSD